MSVFDKMNIFKRVADKHEGDGTRLGFPAKDEGQRMRRDAAMAHMNPNGFRQPKKEPKVDAQGLTRGQRKRIKQAQLRDVARDQIETSRIEFSKGFITL